jgi:hypothetical protein
VSEQNSRRTKQGVVASPFLLDDLEQDDLARSSGEFSPSLGLAENGLRLVLNLLDRQSNTPMSSDVIQVKSVSRLYFDGANQAASDMIERGAEKLLVVYGMARYLRQLEWQRL